MKYLFIGLSILLLSLGLSYAKSDTRSAIVEPIPIHQLEGYKHYPAVVKSLITNGKKLSEMNLTYQYGSADPHNKGMDCSGTMYYLLSQAHLRDVPRDANGMFDWVKEQGKLHRVNNNKFDSTNFSKLKPGDLLFWSGTYATHHAISHVMIYLGKNNEGKHLMFGASNGRTYKGKKMWGVSVFDFNLPDGRDKQKFVGYSCIPELTCEKSSKQ